MMLAIENVPQNAVDMVVAEKDLKDHRAVSVNCNDPLNRDLEPIGYGVPV